MAQNPKILVADDDPIVAESLAEFLNDEGYNAVTAGDGREALNLLEQDQAAPADDPASPAAGPDRIGLIVTDVNMPRCDGMTLLKEVRRRFKSVAVIVITGFGKIESAVEAVKLGAVDYLTKPVVDDELRIAVGKAIQHHALLAENQTLRSQLDQRFGMGNIVGADYRMQKVYDLIEAVAESKTTVLIEGESGTGKSMVARAIHTRSPHRAGPFVSFSCGAIPETLLESELFGHTKGAFTGAETDKPGKCLAADGGTLFIDEINSATPALQLKLLRVLQEKQFEPVGSTQTINVDVRFVLATNQPLADQVAKGAFREDLFYRINVVSIKLPPLRDRLGDIPHLVDFFLEKYRNETGKDRTIGDDAVHALSHYRWPGNVRELENAVERAVVLSRGPVIGIDDLPDTVRHAAGATSVPPPTPTPDNGNGTGHGDPAAFIPALQGGWNPMPLNQALETPERQILLAALEANNWNRQTTARQLDINRTTLYKKIKHHNLAEPN